MPSETYDIAGIKVRMFHPDHNPPHLHVFADGDMAKILIRDGTVFQGRIKRGSYRKVVAWLDRNREALLSKWRELNQ